MTNVQLRAARKRLGMSQAELAAALGYKDRQSIARMEQGEKPITPRAELALMRLGKTQKANRLGEL